MSEDGEGVPVPATLEVAYEGPDIKSGSMDKLESIGGTRVRYLL